MPKITPYQRLMEEAQEYMAKVDYPKQKEMWYYAKKELENGWSLESLYQRVAAADQLGYEVVLTAEDKGLIVKYREKRPKRPWRFR